MSDEHTGAFAHLPAAMTRALPELRRLPVVDEPLSDCSDCSMCEHHYSPAGAPLSFDPNVRCCAYHPDLPNFLAGRALERGGVSAEVIRKRLRDLSGVDPWGITSSRAYDDNERSIVAGFGFDATLLCPFWIGGEHACGIWHDRDATCRTWFCRHGDGLVGQNRWVSVRRALQSTEGGLASRCIDAGSPPNSGTAAEWEAWFRWCARYVAELDADTLRGDPIVAEARAELAECADDRLGALPDVVVAEIDFVARVEGFVAVMGYSRYDIVESREILLDFFDALDGRRTWRQAIAHCDAGDVIDDALIAELHRIGLLQPPQRDWIAAAELPAALAISMRRPMPRDERVFIRGTEGNGTVLAPGAIFEFLAALGSGTPWRDAIADEVDDALVARLVFIGALVPGEADC